MPFRDLNAVVAETAALGEAFAAAGHRVFLVGGIVRDLWLDAINADMDIDLTTDATPAETKAIVAPMASTVWAQGEKFGTIGCTIDDRDFEITTHRVEAYEPGSRKPMVEFASEIDADLSRRDFTVNAMAIELPAGELVDPFDGADDLAAGRLRTPVGAEVSFSDDPLRMLRAARFGARYGLEPADDVVGAMTDLSERLDIVATERVRDEFEKLLAVPQPGDAWLLLHATGLLERVFPRLAAELDADNHAPLAAIAVMDPSDRLARLAALAWWDAGDRSVAGVKRWARGFKLGNSDAGELAQIVTGAEAAASALQDDASLRKWAFAAGPNRGRALQLAGRVRHDVATELRGRVEALAEVEDLDAEGLGLTGEQVMDLLGLEEGPEVGKALAKLRAARFEQGPLTEHQAKQVLT